MKEKYHAFGTIPIFIRKIAERESQLVTDLHWGGFTTQLGNKKRINGADEKYTIVRI